jgi:hypothetical protein
MLATGDGSIETKKSEVEMICKNTKMETDFPIECAQTLSQVVGADFRAQANKVLGWEIYQKDVSEPVLSSTMRIVTIHQTRMKETIQKAMLTLGAKANRYYR